MSPAVIIAIVNTLTGVITQLLTQAKGQGANVELLLAKYDAAHSAAMSYVPIPTPETPQT